ncbi:MBL fold metallo-hydrolase [Actinosynnema sp. NPDC051121]
MARDVERKVVEVADGVFAYVQPDGGWCVNNAGIIVGTERTVVVDTAATVRRATLLKESVDSLSAGREITLVNTHHHGDHCFGNCVFPAGVPVVGHHLARREMREGGLALTHLWPDVEWGEIKLRLPDVTFTESMSLYPGNVEVELLHVGPAHTTNDVVAWLPEQRVLFAGDVVFNGVTPFVLMGSVRGSIAAVERLRALRPETIVPGHGDTGGATLLDRTADYLTWLEDLAGAGRAAGLGPREVAQEADLGAFADLLDSERLVGNLIRAYAETEPGHRLGEPLDVLGAFQEMIAYHGGLPTSHA